MGEISLHWYLSYRSGSLQSLGQKFSYVWRDEKRCPSTTSRHWIHLKKIGQARTDLGRFILLHLKQSTLSTGDDGPLYPFYHASNEKSATVEMLRAIQWLHEKKQKPLPLKTGHPAQRQPFSIENRAALQYGLSVFHKTSPIASYVPCTLFIWCRANQYPFSLDHDPVFSESEYHISDDHLWSIHLREWPAVHSVLMLGQDSIKKWDDWNLSQWQRRRIPWVYSVRFNQNQLQLWERNWWLVYLGERLKSQHA